MTANNYIDAHLHLQDERLYPAATGEIKQRADQAGVKRMLCNATSENDWQQVLNLATSYPSVLPSLGVHPWHADMVSAGWEQRLAQLTEKNTAAIGEIGLDKTCPVPINIQQKIFCQQLDIARQQQVSVSIHCLKSWGLLVDIFKDQSLPERSIIIHSFSGSIQIMDRLLALGAFISFSTQLANPVRKKIKQAFMAVPLDRLLLETDAPDQFCRQLAIGKTTQGQLNEPAMIPALYRHAAGLRGLELDIFTQTLWENSNFTTH